MHAYLHTDVCPFVLPRAQSSDVCARGSTIQQHLCSREHNQAILVLPGAQSSRIRAPGSTNGTGTSVPPPHTNSGKSVIDFVNSHIKDHFF